MKFCARDLMAVGPHVIAFGNFVSKASPISLSQREVTSTVTIDQRHLRVCDTVIAILIIISVNKQLVISSAVFQFHPLKATIKSYFMTLGSSSSFNQEARSFT